MILCAGFGTRLRPLTDFFPKPLLPIGDRPAFQHIVDRLRSGGFGPLVINTHHGAESLAKAVPSDVSALYEPSILGTAGGVANAASALGQGDVLVWNGDIQLDPDLNGLVVKHHRMGSVATLLVAPRPAGEGTVGVSRDGSVARLRGETFLEEVSGADYLGVMMLSEKGRETLPKEGCLVGDVLMPWLRNGGSVGTVVHTGSWVDIGTPERYLRANLAWLRAEGHAAWCASDATVAASVELRETVVAAGGVVTGEGPVHRCVVLAGAVLRAPALGAIALPGGVEVTSCG